MGNRQSDSAQNNELKHIQEINRSDCLYVFGANQDAQSEIIIFDAQKEQFFQQEPPKGMKIIDYMGVIKVSNHLIYLSGGINKQKNHISDDLIEYNPITNSFCNLTRMKNNRYTHCLTYKDRKLYALGGRTYGEGINGLLATCEVYDFSERQWKEIAPLSQPRCTFFTFQYKEEIYVCGGFNGNKKRTETIEKYNEALNIWESIEMKLNRGLECGSIHILEQSRDEFVIFGGNQKEGPTNECWRYNLKKNSCELIGQMQTKRVLSKSILTSKQQIYILGGDKDENLEQKHNHQHHRGGEQENINNNLLQQFNNEIKKEENIFQKILKQIENKEEQKQDYLHEKSEQNVVRMKGDVEDNKVLMQQIFNKNVNHNAPRVPDQQTIEKSSFLSYSLKFETLYSMETDQLFNKRSYQNWKNYSQASEIQVIKCSQDDMISDKKQMDDKMHSNNQSFENPKHKRNNSIGEQANAILKNFLYGNKQDEGRNSHNISLEEVNIMHQSNRHSYSMDIEDDLMMIYNNNNMDDTFENRQKRAVSLSNNNQVLNQLIQGCYENNNNNNKQGKDNRGLSSSVDSDDIFAQLQKDHQNLLLQTFIDNQNHNKQNNNHMKQAPFSRRFYIFGTSDNQDFIAEIDVLNQELKRKQRPKKLKLLSYRSGVRFEESESIFICGGVNDEMTKISNSVYMYYPNEDRIEQLKPMTTRRYTFCCVKKGNFVYVLGGRSYGSDEAAIMSKCERYNITTKEWEVIASMKYRRCSFMASCVENKLYVAGGYGGSMTRHHTFECYHEAENRWELMGIELIEPVEASSLLNIATHDNKVILILGGRSTKDDSDKVYSYDIKYGFDAFQGNQCGILSSKRCLHKQIPLNHDSTTFLLLGGFTKGERISAYSFNPSQNQLQNENKEFQNLINKLDTFLFKDLQTKDTTLRRNLLL